MMMPLAAVSVGKELVGRPVKTEIEPTFPVILYSLAMAC